MIKKMRYQFILVTMASISFIFILILSVINISMTMSSRRQGYSLLYRVADMQMQAKAASPAFMPPKSPPVMEMQAEPPTSPALPAALNKFDIFRSFSVLYGDDGELLDIFYDEHSEMDEESIAALADKVMSKQNAETKGNISKYLYLIRNVPGGIQIFFLDYSLEKEISQRLFRTCLWIGFIGIFFIFLLVVFLSRWIVRPVQSAFDSQKQFIADASHELKTPLTIITANAEVLAGSIGGNKWLENIISQSGRMDKLIKSLLDLARLDSHAQFPGLAFSSFDMGKTVNNAALSFKSLAYEQEKTFHIDIADNIPFYGNEESIRQLVTLLLDNAFKFSNSKGIISLCLAQQDEDKILTVENSGKGIPKEEQQRIFQRFYRSDASRNRESGGYGLGLSIAASIVQMHHGKIDIQSDGSSYARFVVIFKKPGTSFQTRHRIHHPRV